MPQKQYAALLSANFTRGATVEIADEKDAVAKALAAHAIGFSTYDVTVVNVNGKELKGDPENHSPRRWIGLDKIYTRDEVIAELERDLKNAAQSGDLDHFFAQAAKQVIRVYRADPPDGAYITGLERPGEFIKLAAGEKVFNRKGEQMWPQVAAVAAPAPIKDAPKPVKPENKDRWKLQ